ncbi:MAG TPA: type II secretion system secretin GspD [Noviherbaspirillum sp.]|nr:type II secretion system secretin GspD [Noviherbaspirillum sp.]
MKKNQSAETLHNQAGWRRWGATAMLLCAITTGMPPAWAQDPTESQATLNFVGADIESVIKAIGHYTRTTFVIDPRVKGTINLVSEKPVSKAQATQMLASALRLQGFAMVRGDGFTKVVPEADAKLQAGSTKTAEIRGDQIATQIFRLNYESANNLIQVLRPLISPNNTINVNPGNNSLIITDYADNLKRLGRIISALDAPAVGDLDVIPIQHAVASDIAVMVNRLMEQGAGPVAGGDSGRVTMLADPRTNSVILRAPSQARATLAKSLVAKLDQPTSQPGNVHVVYLRNADAVRLAQTLRAVVASDSASQPGGANQPAASPQPPQISPGQQAMLGGNGSQPLTSTPAPTALPTGGPAGFIQADPATNALIITASESVYRNLRAVIEQLDARRAQVYVESLIVEVTAERAAEFGIQWAGLSGDASSRYRVGGATGFTTQGGGNNLISQAISKATENTLLPPGNGLSLGIFRQVDGSLNLGALARALESEGNANILSMPNLITLDNEEARIIVGQNVPFITGSFTTTAGSNQNPFQTIERKDVGLSLRVRPQVSEGGTVKMAIYQETSNIQPTSNASDIITNKRSVETNVLVDDGQIIVLGGLIEDRVNDGIEKVPGLGDIPVLGNFFKYQTRKGNKTNLMIFLRPTVIRTAEQSVNVVNDRYDFIRGVQAGAQPPQTLVLPNMNAPLLPPLQDGRPSAPPLLDVRPRNGGGVQPIPSVTVPMPAPNPAPANEPVPEQNESR